MTKLEWCRANAPKGLGDLSDVKLLELMGSSYERFVEDTDLKFVNFDWTEYNLLRNPTYLNEQLQLLHETHLVNFINGKAFSFIPTARMEKLEKEILELYQQVDIVDHDVELCTEVFYTSKIEGAVTTLLRTQEIHAGAALDKANLFSESMLSGGFNATKYLNAAGNKVNEKILLKVWNILTENCCSNLEIRGEKYRCGEVQVGNHIGLRFTHVDKAMSAWIEFYNSNDLNNHPFIKAALLHYSFESIHPFCDGNGRMGRLLFSNFLIGSGLEKFKAISVSRSIEKEVRVYYYAFTQADNDYSDCTYFIEYMLLRIRDALYDVLDLY